MDRSSLNILILEDLKTDVQLLKRAVLKVAPGSMFAVATNEEEFIDRLQWSKCDLVIADYHLPTYNGLQALLFVRANYPHLPFIFVSGSLNDEEEVAQTILSGASGYILKSDLANFGPRFNQALDRIEAEIIKREDAQEQQRQLQLKLNKLANLLEQSSDFPEKGDLQNTVQELMQLL